MEERYLKIVQKWKEQKLDSKLDIDNVLYNFRILFAYNSGKIENEKIDFNDTREIFEKGKVSSYSGDIKTLFEQQNQKDCYEFLCQMIADKEPLSIDLIKKIHFELTKGTYDERRYNINNERPGEFKKHDYVVGRNEVGTLPEDVEKELEELIFEVSTTETKDILKAGCYLHAVFENIHPFADGNGRVGRTVMNYYLMTHGHPPIIVFEEERKEYYQALEKFDTNDELDSLYTFAQNQCVKTWSRQIGQEKISTIKKRPFDNRNT